MALVETPRLGSTAPKLRSRQIEVPFKAELYMYRAVDTNIRPIRPAAGCSFLSRQTTATKFASRSLAQKEFVRIRGRSSEVHIETPPPTRELLHEQATGGFAGPGSLTTTSAGTIQLTEEDGGSVLLSGTFLRDDGAALPSSTSVFIYTENTAQPDDFVRGQEALDPSTGAFSTVVTDIPEGSSRLFLSFVVVDPVEALETAGADTAFALDVSNSACVPSLTITLEWTGETSDVDLYVVEPGGTVVSYGNRFGVSEVSTERVFSGPSGRPFFVACCRWMVIWGSRTCLSAQGWATQCPGASSEAVSTSQ